MNFKKYGHPKDLQSVLRHSDGIICIQISIQIYQQESTQETSTRSLL